MKSLKTSRLLVALVLSTTLVPAAVAQSAPQPVPIIDRVPEPEDRPLSAPMKLEVDATDVARAIFRVKQTIPVEAGKPLTLLYPQWLPGKHGPRGALAEMTGLKVRANGLAIPSKFMLFTSIRPQARARLTSNSSSRRRCKAPKAVSL
jgi:hypothetical protein